MVGLARAAGQCAWRARAPNTRPAWQWRLASARGVCARAQHADEALPHLQQQHGSLQLPQQQSQHPPERVFAFRHFTLRHGGACAMHMGTDAMLLGAWAEPPPGAAAVLDVGTGSGVLALMMAQKLHHHHQRQQALRVHAIDVDDAAVAQATANAAASPWAASVAVARASLQDWAQDASRRYDLIISNPPYFLRSSKPAAARRAAARHADGSLPFAALAACAARLLAPAGRLCVVLPVPEAQLFAAEAAAAGLQLTWLTQVFTKSTDTQPKRHLMQFEHPRQRQRAHRAVAPERLVVMEQRTQQPGGSSAAAAVQGWRFSQQYRALTAGFHHPELLAKQ